MILVFGGTTEGKLVSESLEKKKWKYIYSTKTESSNSCREYGVYRSGAFNQKGLISFCRENNIRVIVHASHPFASELHQTIDQAAERISIPVLRYERVYPERFRNEKVSYVASYKEAINKLTDLKVDRLLAFTGVQTISKLRDYWKEYYTLFRILPRESSVNMAVQQSFPKEQLLLEMPGDNIEHEVNIIEKYKINGVLTKESGESGFLSVKINAAMQVSVPIVIIERPELPERFVKVYSEGELIEKLVTLER